MRSARFHPAGSARPAALRFIRPPGGTRRQRSAACRGRALTLIQVCHDIERIDTFERETRALKEAMAETRLDEAWLINPGRKRRLREDGRTIHLVPPWEWLLTTPGLERPD